MSLSQSQQEALDNLWAVTASGTEGARQRDKALLEENGWNVQATVEQIFSMDGQEKNDWPDAGPSLTTASSQTRVQDPLRSPVRGLRRSGNVGGRPKPRGARGTATVGLSLWSIVAFPVNVVIGLVSGVWYFIIGTFMPLAWLPHLPQFLLPPTPGWPTGHLPQDPTTACLNFVRDLEVFTSSSSQDGTLPSFYVGPYREFLMHLRKEGVVGLVVLVSAEHEDDGEFKRGTLCDRDVVKTLKDEHVAVWAADISSREGYQVSQTLLTTCYPSLTFLSTLPSSSSTPKLSILTTIAGSPSTSTSPMSVLHTLQTSILPRTRPFHTRLRNERLALEETRHLRAEQDRALREAERRDREKLVERQKKDEAERLQKARLAEETLRQAKRQENRREWRRFARSHLLPPNKGTIRVSIRTPLSAERHIRQFQPSTSTVDLFVYAETLLISSCYPASDDPSSPPEGVDPLASEGAALEEEFAFSLVTAYPRQEVQCVKQGGEAVWDMIKKNGGALFIEKKEGREWEWRDSGEESEEEIDDKDS
nr:hypothetical protein L203_06164 [Cryptococcus depauperatus CBS 7841]